MQIKLIRSSQIDGKWLEPGTLLDVAKEVAIPLIRINKAVEHVKEKASAGGKRSRPVVDD